MIRVNRPKRAPAVFSREGAAEKEKDIQRFSRGERAFEFDPKIYGSQVVKRVLVKAQHQKCCFCESKVTHVASGHIEHFRPKGGFRQANGDGLEKPGYYWLAYEWTNLLFSCELCNSRFKKNHFPLVDPSKRARSHHDDVDDELPLFLDPANEDPTEYIGFREEYPHAIDGSERGEATWRALGLDREELASVRRSHLRTVRALTALAKLDLPESQDARSLLEEFQKPEAQWSAMVRAAMSQQ